MEGKIVKNETRGVVILVISLIGLSAEIYNCIRIHRESSASAERRAVLAEDAAALAQESAVLAEDAAVLSKDSDKVIEDAVALLEESVKVINKKSDILTKEFLVIFNDPTLSPKKKNAKLEAKINEIKDHISKGKR